MLKFVRFIVGLFLFWIILFNLHRVVFLLAFASSADAGFASCLTAFPHSLPLDLSAAAYLSIIPFLLGFAMLFVKDIARHRLMVAIKIYLITVLVLVCLVQAGDMAVYREWQVKLPYKAIEHLRHPMEPILTASPRYVLAFAGTFLLEFLTGIVLYRWLCKKLFPQGGNKLSYIPIILWLLIGGVIFLFMRGGWGQFPISVSSAYFSNKAVLNDASANSPWQFGADVWAHFDRDDAKLYQYYPDDKAHAVVQSLYSQKDSSTVSILKNQRPNIVVILLESWSADVVGCLGEFKGLTPAFDSLASDGLLFTDFYANSWMSEKGNVAVLSGVPSLPTVSIFDRPGIFRRMPSINQSLQKVGYNSSYYYGGYLYFENIRSYLLDHGIQKIVDREDIGNKLPMGQLGVHDGDMMPYFLSELNKQSQPFFSILFTLSTHSPYDIPGQKVENGAGEVQPYMNAIKYADHSLGLFFQQARKQPWYGNTLFVLVADHSHATPHYREPWEKDRFRIPLLLYGPALKDVNRGKKINRMASQMDIASTLLHQLNISAKDFVWSKNVFSDSMPGFVPYSFPSGCGWIEPGASIAWNVNTGLFLSENQQQQNCVVCVERGKCFFQELWKNLLLQ